MKYALIKKGETMNIGELMKKAQQVQTQVNILQTKMGRQEFTGTAANNAVSVTITGKGEATKVQITKDVVNPADVETLEDLVLVAINDAHAKAEAYQQTEIEKIQAGLRLPPDFKMPF